MHWDTVADSAGPGPNGLRATRAAIEKVIRQGAPGAVAVVSRKADPITGLAAGRAAPGAALTVSTASPWSCAGKPLLAAACMRAVATGQLDLDVPVQHWRPEFGRLHPATTPRNLLTNEAGVDESSMTGDPSSRPLHDWAPVPGAVLGKDFFYSVWWNWRVLGTVLESVTGVPVESTLAAEVLRPAGINDSSFLPGAPAAARAGDVVPERTGAVEFSRSAAARTWYPTESLGLEHRDASTRLCGPLTDLLRFYQSLRESVFSSSGPLPTELAYEMITQGLGVVMSMKSVGFGKYCSPRSVGYGGALAGNNVVVGLFEPDHDFVLAVLVNRIGRASALGLRTIVTAVYEDMLS